MEPISTPPGAAATTRERLVSDILRPLPADTHDRLVSVLRDGPWLYEKLTGERPHEHRLLRHARDGVLGIRLTTVCAGRRLLTTARWIAEHLVDVAAARLNGERAGRVAEPGGRP